MWWAPSFFFIARHCAQHFLVGNGTNFVGADKEILECIMNWNYVAPTVFAHEGIAWKFNTPRAPHHGGSWKRLVRSVKRVLHDILGSRTVTEKVRGTKLCLVDQALNARPITPVSTDSRDLEALAPQSRFAWTLCRKLSFAICWRTLRPYADVNIVLLATRMSPYWTSVRSGTPNLTGDLVWVIESDIPRAYYPLALIVKLNYSKDGCARSALSK